jgi:hypothetical protein
VRFVGCLLYTTPLNSLGPLPVHALEVDEVLCVWLQADEVVQDSREVRVVRSVVVGQPALLAPDPAFHPQLLQRVELRTVPSLEYNIKENIAKSYENEVLKTTFSTLHNTMREPFVQNGLFCCTFSTNRASRASVWAPRGLLRSLYVTSEEKSSSLLTKSRTTQGMIGYLPMGGASWSGSANGALEFKFGSV